MRTCRPLTPGPGVRQSRAPTTRHLPDETPPPARGPPAPSSLAAQRPTSLSARRQVCGPRHVSPSEAGMPGALWAGVPPPAPTSSAAGQGPRAVSRETSRLGGGPLGLRQASPPRQDGLSQAGPQLITFPQGCRCWGLQVSSLSLWTVPPKLSLLRKESTGSPQLRHPSLCGVGQSCRAFSVPTRPRAGQGPRPQRPTPQRLLSPFCTRRRGPVLTHPGHP